MVALSTASLLVVSSLLALVAADAEPSRRIPDAAELAREDASCMLQTEGSLRRAAAASKSAAKGPFHAGWFGGFDQGESTFDDEGVDADSDFPERSVLHGADPSLRDPIRTGHVNIYDQFPARFFHESRSGGDIEALQTHYPDVPGSGGQTNFFSHLFSAGNNGMSIAGNRHIAGNAWEATPEGWIQEYNPETTHTDATSGAYYGTAGPNRADWFDNSVRQLDGFGRRMMPDREDGDYYLRGGLKGSKGYKAGWEERSVNTTIACKKISCVGKSALQLFDASKEEARRCKLSIHVHATDYDDDWSREHIEYWKVNDHIATRQCNPRARGCNSTADRPMYPCVNDLDVDKIVDSKGTLVIEGKNTHMVDECPYSGNLLSAIAMSTCMVRALTTTTTTPTVKTATAKFTLGNLHSTAELMCNSPGCEAETMVKIIPALAFNGGKCTMNIDVRQTDYDDHLGMPEQVEWLQLEGKNISKGVKPGKNPCNMRYAKKKVTEKDEVFHAVKNKDVTKQIKDGHPPGHLRIGGKISPNVDECAYKGWLFYATVHVTCKPPKKYAAKPKKGAKKLLASPKKGAKFLASHFKKGAAKSKKGAKVLASHLKKDAAKSEDGAKLLADHKKDAAKSEKGAKVLASHLKKDAAKSDKVSKDASFLNLESETENDPGASV